MTTIAWIIICFLVACLAYLIGWIRGCAKAVRFYQGLEVEAESDDFVQAQREVSQRGWQ